jgi:hypothetical protein
MADITPVSVKVNGMPASEQSFVIFPTQNPLVAFDMNTFKQRAGFRDNKNNTGFLPQQ